MNDLESTLFQQLAYACSETRQAFDQSIGMSQPRRQILGLVSQAKEISHASLQQQIGLDGATITRLVKQFEAEGVLTRRLDPNDNRYMLVSLTESGQHMVDGLNAVHGLFQTQLLTGISREEQEMIVRVLEQLRQNIRTLQETRQDQT
jgi:DNA-binding MarR family transcriptional regulator